MEEFLLAQEYKMKLHLVAVAVKDNNLSILLGIMKVLLDAPISDGGIATETLERVRSNPDDFILKLTE